MYGILPLSGKLQTVGAKAAEAEKGGKDRSGRKQADSLDDIYNMKVIVGY